jgi:hypothetical protein
MTSFCDGNVFGTTKLKKLYLLSDSVEDIFPRDEDGESCCGDVLWSCSADAVLLDLLEGDILSIASRFSQTLTAEGEDKAKEGHSGMSEMFTFGRTCDIGFTFASISETMVTDAFSFSFFGVADSVVESESMFLFESLVPGGIEV